MIHITDARKGTALFEALDSEIRLEILNLLNREGEANLKEIAGRMNITNGAVTAHIRKLQNAGLIKVRSAAGGRGAQKLCSLAASKIIVDLFDEEATLKSVYSFDIGVGHYTDYKIKPTCGIAMSSAIIGELDDIRYFSFPERIDACMLWFAEGYITYKLPNNLKASEACSELQIGVELASEAPGYTTNYPSDIGFKINRMDLGYFTSPGEFNDRRGIFTPSWWFENLGQYGRLKLLTINDSGCYIDGRKTSNTTISDLSIYPQSDIFFTIEVPETAINKGGVTLFGKGFGDYDTGIAVKMFYQ